MLEKDVVVVGGGPAGSMGGLLLAREGLGVTIIEPRSTRMPDIGEKGKLCVGCAGLLQENVLGLLESFHLSIPEEVIQSRIYTNVLHLPGGQAVEIPTKTVTVYRGFGPVRSPAHFRGFDAWLLDEASKAGARVIEARVGKIDLSNKGSFVYTLKDEQISADIIIGAYGHNPMNIPLEAPKIQDACVREYLLGDEVVSKLEGANHVFISPTEAIGFAAIIPKKEFVSMALIGRGRSGVEQASFDEFLDLKSVTDLVGNLSKTQLRCACKSTITVQSPGRFFIENREGGIAMINIGDAGPSRIKKNGIGAALDSASKLAQALIDFGNTPEALEKYRSYMYRHYISDNSIAEPMLNFIDLLLKEPHTRQIMTYVLQHNIPIPSRLSRIMAAHLLSGEGAYWALPFTVLRETLGL